jgi:hypothetical protein
LYEEALLFSSSRFCQGSPKVPGRDSNPGGRRSTNELPYAIPQCYIRYTLFRKESVEGQDLPGSAAYQDQLLEATALLLRTRDVRAKSADLENKGTGIIGSSYYCAWLFYYNY